MVKIPKIKRVKKNIKDLRPSDYNPRFMEERRMKGLERSVQKFGLVQDIVWNKRTGNVVGGHQRLIILQRSKIKQAEVVEVDLSPEEEKELNLALNNPENQGVFVAPKLQNILIELKELPDFEPLQLDKLEDLSLEDIPTGPNKKEESEPDQKPKQKEGYFVEVLCENKTEQMELVDWLTEEGYSCIAIKRKKSNANKKSKRRLEDKKRSRKKQNQKSGNKETASNKGRTGKKKKKGQVA